MVLEFSVAVKALVEYIAILKQEFLFAMAEHKPDKRIMSHKLLQSKESLIKPCRKE